MLFTSRHANLEVLCRNQYDKRHPVTGDIIETTPAVWARFGKMGATYTYTDPLTQQDQTGADIYGHFYDTDAEALENGWDEDTKGLVERTLVRFCNTQPDRIQQINLEVPKAALPWPTYDATPAENVAELAQTLGLVVEAIAYEQENRARPLVLDTLAGLSVQADPDPDAPELVEEVVPRISNEPQPVGNPRTITV